MQMEEDINTVTVHPHQEVIVWQRSQKQYCTTLAHHTHPKPAKRPVLLGFFELGENETREVDVPMETPEGPKSDPRTESSQAKGLN